MRRLLPLLALSVMLPSFAEARFGNFPAADRVLGATGFNAAGDGAAGASGMDEPTGIAIDPTSGKIFVAVAAQNRVLRFANAASLASGANAEAVLGQINLSGTSAGASQTTMEYPLAVVVDGQGRLWVADTLNHRILRFDGAATLANGAPADRVLGQTNFTNDSSGSGSAGLNYPSSLSTDPAGNLWVADYLNNRVLRYGNAAALANGAAATNVLGQATFAIISPGTSQTKMQRPTEVHVDAAGRLWVSEQLNHRVLRFDGAAGLGNGPPASAVLGQPDFTSLAAGLGPAAVDNPSGLVVDADGTLYVVDTGNHRVLLYRGAAAKGNGAPADRVIGQTGLASQVAGVSPRNLSGPYGNPVFDAGGALWICDGDNNRVLRFTPDRTRPKLRVTTSIPSRVSSARLALAGKASDTTSGIVSVEVRVNKRPPRPAAGTTSWRAKAKLDRGANRLTVTATDGAGNVSAPKRARVTRGG